MSIVVLIPDGVGVRNFLLGDFLKSASERQAVLVLHRIPERLLDAGKFKELEKVSWEPLLPHCDSPWTLSLRNSLSYAHMYHIGSKAMRYNLDLPVTGTWRRRFVMKAARAVGRAAGLAERGVLALETLHLRANRRLNEVEHYRKLFRKFRPSILFSSHQRPLEIIPAVIAARDLGIPTATFIFSWDNLSSKGRIPVPFDHYLVWSEHMRGELLRYYSNIAGDRVQVVGTPQFDPYADENLLWTREEFFQRIGADATRPLICYSGGDASIAPEDPQHLRILLDLIREKKIKRDPQVLLRPTPVDDFSRYKEVRADYPELIYAEPRWERFDESWSAVIPQAEDTQFLANLTRHSDLNINLSSTMTLDFAIHDKPVVNIAFDVSSPPPFKSPLWEHHYRFEHYLPVVELGAARFARSPHELAKHVNDYLGDPGLDREGRRQFVALEVSLPLGDSSRRIARVIERLARDWQPPSTGAEAHASLVAEEVRT